MLNNGSKFSSDYLKTVLKDSIIAGYEVDYVEYKNTYPRRSTKMADNPFIKDRIHHRITEKLGDNSNYIVYSNTRGSSGHILVFDKVTEKLYSVIQKNRYKTIKKEAIDPSQPPHYVFIYAQLNPLENEDYPTGGLIPFNESDLSDSLVLKRNYAKEELKKYLRNLNPESFVLIVYDLDRNTDTIASIEASTPSSLNLTSLNKIENWLEHNPVFSFEPIYTEAEDTAEANDQLKGLDLKPNIKKQLEDRDNLSVVEKKAEKDSKDAD
ncbi:DUF5986 family protein [Priestia sp. FSL R5-0680]|uniref:DUF5986 family protein n=1 Tax=Priestia sp. FSL R5-0680 TaxID=2921582 RepID=UPI0030FC53B3